MLKRGLLPVLVAGFLSLGGCDDGVEASATEQPGVSVEREDKTPAEEKEASAYPLHEAAQRGDKEAVQRYLKEGYDVNQVNEKGRTPLLAAIPNDMLDFSENTLATMRILLEHGGDVEKATRMGMKPVRVAMIDLLDDDPDFSKRLQMLKLLHEYGASFNTRSEEGHSILSYAVGELCVSHHQYNPEIVKSLVALFLNSDFKPSDKDRKIVWAYARTSDPALLSCYEQFAPIFKKHNESNER